MYAFENDKQREGCKSKSNIIVMMTMYSGEDSSRKAVLYSLKVGNMKESERF